jgi:hypothetical protein
VARGSYVDPRIVERFENGETVEDVLSATDVRRLTDALEDDGETPDDVDEVVLPSVRAEIDAAVADLIDGTAAR